MDNSRCIEIRSHATTKLALLGLAAVAGDCGSWTGEWWDRRVSVSFSIKNKPEDCVCREIRIMLDSGFCQTVTREARLEISETSWVWWEKWCVLRSLRLWLSTRYAYFKGLEVKGKLEPEEHARRRTCKVNYIVESRFMKKKLQARIPCAGRILMCSTMREWLWASAKPLCCCLCIKRPRRWQRQFNQY